MVIKIKLLPPVLIGRYFQALVLYLANIDIIKYEPEYIIVDLTETELYEQLCKIIKEYYERHGDIEEIPSGKPDTAFFNKVIGKEKLKEYRKRIQELKKRKDSRRRVQEELKEFWCNVIRNLMLNAKEVLKNNQGSIDVRLFTVKVNLYEFVKMYLVPSSGSIRNNKNIEPIQSKEALYGEALAITGMLMSKVGNVDKKDIRVLPPLPESLREGVLRDHVLRRYWAVVSHRPHFSKNLPISADIYVHFHYTVAFAKEKIFDQFNKEVCMNPFDALTLVTISGGNRPIVTNSFLLMSSEIFCKLYSAVKYKDKNAVTSMLSNLLALLRNEKVGDQAGNCLNNIYQYVISSNPQKLYDCARSLKALSLNLQSNLSREEIARIERTIEYMAKLR